jgi:hypothetical protein
MQWFVTNWFWILIGVAFVAMHMFGHGGHGGHGGHTDGRHDVLRPDQDMDPADDTESQARQIHGGHQH